ncbi:MAG: Ldh family oxidoreductase [Chloroflexota bacterium]|nr:Ldh family oxidoreductase [Chloroflexota bacterium]
MLTIPADVLTAAGVSLLSAAGLPAKQAVVATDHLVESNLVGHDSHGVIRIPYYVKGLRSGELAPVGNQKVVRETPSTLVLDANHSFGIVLAYDAMREAVKRAQIYSFGAVAVHRSGHIGRLGAYPVLAAEQDCIGVILLNGGAQFMAPFGGTARRLPPNPIAIAVPSADGSPLMLDMTTSVAAGGKVDVQLARRQPLPEGWLIDAGGNPVTDPERFRGSDVAMLPLGGPLGHKGYGLAMMIDAIAGGLSWAGCSAEEPTRGGSGYLALAIKIDSFIDPDEYKREIQKLADWVKSSPLMPGVKKIYVPGEVEEESRHRRLAEGVPVEEATWDAISEAAAELGVALPAV